MQVIYDKKEYTFEYLTSFRPKQILGIGFIPLKPSIQMTKLKLITYVLTFYKHMCGKLPVTTVMLNIFSAHVILYSLHRCLQH